LEGKQEDADMIQPSTSAFYDQGTSVFSTNNNSDARILKTYQDADAATRRKEPPLQQLFLYKII
jgi:hypothetical protein